MPYFGISLERYGGYNREEELEGTELPPWREPREEKRGCDDSDPDDSE